MRSTVDTCRWWAAPLTLAVLILGFDVTILHVALSTIATDLDASHCRSGTAGGRSRCRVRPCGSPASSCREPAVILELDTHAHERRRRPTTRPIHRLVKIVACLSNDGQRRLPPADHEEPAWVPTSPPWGSLVRRMRRSPVRRPRRRAQSPCTNQDLPSPEFGTAAAQLDSLNGVERVPGIGHRVAADPLDAQPQRSDAVAVVRLCDDEHPGLGLPTLSVSAHCAGGQHRRRRHADGTVRPVVVRMNPRSVARDLGAVGLCWAHASPAAARQRRPPRTAADETQAAPVSRPGHHRGS